MKIIERKLSHDIFYVVDSQQSNGVTQKYVVRCTLRKHYDESHLFYLLFDHNFELINETYSYLNIYLTNKGYSNNTRDKTATALKYLYSYLGLFNINLYKMTNDDVIKFVKFLQGISVVGVDVEFEFSKSRSASSVNDYLSLVRQYLTYLNLYKNPLLKSKKYYQYILLDSSSNKITKNKYIHTIYNYKDNTIPKYISLEQYKAIYNYTNTAKLKKIHCIIRLMFESGMRIGEVLSLTFEDIKVDFNIDGKNIYKVVVRSRLNCRKFQHGKNLLRITSSKQYETKEYRIKGYGYQNCFISGNLYETLMEFIEIDHSDRQDSNFSSWTANATTDSVDFDKSDQTNFFIFLNKKNSPLSNITVNQIIKHIFKECNIPLGNEGGKFDGLCHRFRHGFAMYQIEQLGTKVAELSTLMRHRSINSTMIYYNPTDESIAQFKEEMSNDLYSKFETLKQMGEKIKKYEKE